MDELDRATNAIAELLARRGVTELVSLRPIIHITTDIDLSEIDHLMELGGGWVTPVYRLTRYIAEVCLNNGDHEWDMGFENQVRQLVHATEGMETAVFQFEN